MLNRNNAIVVLLIALWVGTWAVRTDRIELPDWLPTTQQVDRVTYVYEKDEGGVPPNIQAALMNLNEGGKVIATEFEEDIVDGDGQVPDQYKIAAEAAKEAGTPCLVVQAGERVVDVLPTTDKTTIAEVMEAVK